MLLVFRKNRRKWNYRWNFVLKTRTTLFAGILKWICCFDKVFSIALTSTEQHFIERSLYRRFLHTLFPVTCVKKFLCNVTIFYFLRSHWRCSIRKGVPRNFPKFTGKYLWQSLFFDKVAGWGDYFWSFSCLLFIVQSKLSLKTVPCDFFVRSNCYIFLESLLT